MWPHLRRVEPKGKRKLELDDATTTPLELRSQELYVNKKIQRYVWDLQYERASSFQTKKRGNWSSAQLRKAIKDVHDGYNIKSAPRNLEIPDTSFRSHFMGDI